MRRLFGWCLVASALTILSGACSDPAVTPPAARLCTPDSNVSCLCANSENGTKKCGPDGLSYITACRKDENTPCPTGGTEDAGGAEDGASGIGSLEACPGKTISIGATGAIVEDSTATATDDAKGATGSCAAGEGAPDHVYKLLPTTTGLADIQVIPEAGFDAVVYARIGDDCGAAPQFKCGSSGGAAAREVLTNVPLINGRPVYLIVDGAAGNSSKGKYKLDIKVTPGPYCGDGKITTDEACDDANTIPGDGCNPGCMVVDGNPDSAVGCAAGGQPVEIWPGKTVTGKGSTDPAVFTKAVNSFKETGTACGISSPGSGVAPDHLYKVIPRSSGDLVVAVTNATFNVLLYARKVCAVAATQDAPNMCANANGATVPNAETLTFPVTNGTPYYVVVDGALTGKGNFDISFKVQ